MIHADSLIQSLPNPADSSGEALASLDFVARLDRDLRPRMIAILKSRGASWDLAEDLASDIFSECVAESPCNLINRFKGDGPIDAWLLRVAINRLISHHRRERLVELADFEEIDSLPCENSRAIEDALHGIVSGAISRAIEFLSVEAKLLLWLHYGYKIPQNRLCVCWQSTASKISRTLSSARNSVRESAIRSIQKKEPGLHLEWQDISEVGVDSGVLL